MSTNVVDRLKTENGPFGASTMFDNVPEPRYYFDNNNNGVNAVSTSCSDSTSWPAISC